MLILRINIYNDFHHICFSALATAEWLGAGRGQFVNAWLEWKSHSEGIRNYNVTFNGAFVAKNGQVVGVIVVVAASCCVCCVSVFVCLCLSQPKAKTLVAYLIAIVIQRAFIVITKAKQWPTFCCCCRCSCLCVLVYCCLVWHDNDVQHPDALKQQSASTFTRTLTLTATMLLLLLFWLLLLLFLQISHNGRPHNKHIHTPTHTHTQQSNLLPFQYVAKKSVSLYPVAIGNSLKVRVFDILIV